MKARMNGLVAGGALTIAIGASALAQPAPGPGPGPMAGPRAGAMAAGAQSPADRAARLRDLLQLRSNQESALQSYVAALDSAHRGMIGPGGAPWPKTTPERLARAQQMMAQHQSAMSAMIEATRRFYDQLDAGQKRAFDAMPMTTLRMGGVGKFRGRGTMGGWGMTGWPDAAPTGTPQADPGS